MSAINTVFKAAIAIWDRNEHGGTSSLAEFILMVVIKKTMRMRGTEVGVDLVPFTPSPSELSSGEELILYFLAIRWFEEDLSNLSKKEIEERVGEMFSHLEVIGKKGRQAFDAGLDPSDATLQDD